MNTAVIIVALLAMSALPALAAPFSTYSTVGTLDGTDRPCVGCGPSNGAVLDTNLSGAVASFKNILVALGCSDYMTGAIRNFYDLLDPMVGFFKYAQFIKNPTDDCDSGDCDNDNDNDDDNDCDSDDCGSGSDFDDSGSETDVDQIAFVENTNLYTDNSENTNIEDSALYNVGNADVPTISA